ncbi:MAG: hypothetical protein J3K34DRAFT_230637 [Monoraphidium minutum]|nr:MAG: hypothetical protein J3K34DRAFT_230637 [Monoraphidium minutum]
MLDLQTYSSSLLVSGTSAALLKLGDQVESAPNLAGDNARRRFGRGGDALQQLGDGDGSGGGAAAGGKSKIGSNITIKDLIDNGLIAPGPGAVTVTYKNRVTAGDLAEDGGIDFGGQRFATASAFSVHVKRLQTPSKAGDDGWRSVHGAAGGASLHDLRARLLQALGQQAAAAGAGRARGRPARGRPTTYREAEEEDIFEDEPPAPTPEPVEVHWVQCSRCERWRVVPDANWGAIASADEDADWFCEHADWDVVKFEPFEPACATA